MVRKSETDENTEKLSNRARELINAEFRGILLKYARSRPAASTPQGAHVAGGAAAVRTARKQIRREWEALKNGTVISRDSDSPATRRAHYKRSIGDVLRGVVAYIEINNVPKAIALSAILQQMGASVRDEFSMDVTHVVFKRGSWETLERARRLNVHAVSVLWLEACRAARAPQPESLYPAACPHAPEGAFPPSPRALRRLLEQVQQDESNILEKLKSAVVQKSKSSERRVTRSTLNERTVNTDSSEGTLVLHVSTDDSGRQVASEEKADRAATTESPPNFVNNQQRRLFAKSNDLTIDHVYGKEKEFNPALKRKLFTQTAEEVLRNRDEYDSSDSLSSVDGIENLNPYRIPGQSKTQRKKIIKNRARVKVQQIVAEEHSSSGSDEERAECVRVLLNMPGGKKNNKAGNVKESRKKNEVLTKTVRKKKLTQEEKASIKKANKMARRREKQMRLQSQPLLTCGTGGGDQLVLVGTSLHRAESQRMCEAARALGAGVRAAVTRGCTHVVAGAPRRTINLLRGLSRGLWLVDARWVEDSASAGRWLPEHPYELTSFSPTVQRSRIARSALGAGYRLDVFGSAGAVHVHAECRPPAAVLRELLRLCGGRATPSPAAAAVLVAPSTLAEDIPAHVRAVSEQWLLDSVTAGRAKSVAKYALVPTA